MAEEAHYTESEAHRKFAGDLFNSTWALMEKADRSKAEDELMLQSAFASRYHWGKIGGPEQFTVGEWQIARVYALLGNGDQSRHHAQRALEICLENRINDFPLASAFEGLAHAAKIQGQTDDAHRFAILARHACAQIKDADDRRHIENQIESLGI